MVMMIAVLFTAEIMSFESVNNTSTVLACMRNTDRDPQTQTNIYSESIVIHPKAHGT